MNEESIFAGALKLPDPEQRRAYLDDACQGNAELRTQIDELLKASGDAGSFLVHPPTGLMPTFASDQAQQETLKSGPTSGELPFLEPCHKPARIGMLVGKVGEYEIIEVVGRGGMGTVLRAYDTKLSRVVAVKVMAPELAANPTAVQRFLREAKSAAAVHHDHVVTIHAIDDTHRPPFLVMQFVEGQTLEQKIANQGALELKQVLRIGSQIAAGLAAAHKHGLIHRDVKPGNILLENGVERVKITDFGLARAADDMEVTKTGQIAGTPQYMSPEQAKGDPIDVRSDLFSLGSVLYAMCTGRAAFRADNALAVMRRVCDDTPRPICELNAEIPAWLEKIVTKLLAKDPGQRFQTAGEVAELLGQHLSHVQNPGQVAPPKSIDVTPASGTTSGRSRRPVVFAAVAALLLIGLAITEASGVTTLAATIIRITTGEGTIVVQVDDPTIKVTVDGQDIVITEAGAQEIRVRPGQHQIAAVKNGKPVAVDQPLVTISRGGRQVVSVTLEAAQRATEVSTIEQLDVTDGGTYRAGDWIKLFNGQDLTGWRPLPPERWRVENGVIHTSGPGAFLLSDADDFEDFHMLVEYRINAIGDSGVHFRAPPPLNDPQRGWLVAGFEAEIGLQRHPNYRTGALSVKPPFQNLATGLPTLHAPQDWGRLDIVARKTHIQIFVDGRLAADCVDRDGTFQRGHVALSSWENDNNKTIVAFRRVEIRRLAPAAQELAPSQPRNPFGLPDVPDPDGADVQAFAQSIKLDGGIDDANAFAWTRNQQFARTGSIEGEWSARWNGGVAAKHWVPGVGVVRSIGDRVYMLIKDQAFVFLVDARRVGANRLVGRHVNVNEPREAYPWVGTIVGADRIDGHWSAGRLDLRRTLQIVRNPFNVADVKDPDGADVQAFAKSAKLDGGASDVNAEAWAHDVQHVRPGSIEGQWSGRWNGGGAGKKWVSGTATATSLGDRVYILFQDSNDGFLIDAQRTGADLLVGRYQTLSNPNDSTPWVGRFIGPDRIDGQWQQGRFDFRRKAEYVRNPFGLADVSDPDGADAKAFAANVKLDGAANDANALQWTYEAGSAEDGSIDGHWAGRWKYGKGEWVISTAEIKSIDDRVFIRFGDSDYLLEARRVKDRLVGRYKNINSPSDSTPWVGRIVGPDRIDGLWNDGSTPPQARWDFRRSLSPVPLAPAPTFTSSVDFNGSWDSRWGEVKFTHPPSAGDEPFEVQGTYNDGAGRIIGTVDPKTRTMTGTFREPNTGGKIRLVLSAGNAQITGHYGYKNANQDDPIDKYQWDMTRSTPPPAAK